MKKDVIQTRKRKPKTSANQPNNAQSGHGVNGGPNSNFSAQFHHGIVKMEPQSVIDHQALQLRGFNVPDGNHPLANAYIHHPSIAANYYGQSLPESIQAHHQAIARKTMSTDQSELQATSVINMSSSYDNQTNPSNGSYSVPVSSPNGIAVEAQQ